MAVAATLYPNRSTEKIRRRRVLATAVRPWGASPWQSTSPAPFDWREEHPEGFSSSTAEATTQFRQWPIPRYLQLPCHTDNKLHSVRDVRELPSRPKRATPKPARRLPRLRVNLLMRRDRKCRSRRRLEGEPGCAGPMLWLATPCSLCVCDLFSVCACLLSEQGVSAGPLKVNEAHVKDS